MPELRTISHTDAHTAHTVITVSGELDIATVDPFRESATEAIAASAGGERVVLDCGELAFIDSSGLQALIQCLKECERHGKWFLLAAPSDRVARVLRVTALDRRIPAHSTVAEALNAPLPDFPAAQSLG